MHNFGHCKYGFCCWHQIQWHPDLLYWVGQKVSLGYSIRCYKNRNKLFGQPNIMRMMYLIQSYKLINMVIRGNQDPRSAKPRSKSWVVMTLRNRYILKPWVARRAFYISIQTLTTNSQWRSNLAAKLFCLACKHFILNWIWIP